MKTTRRGLFGIFAGALAAPAVAKIAPFAAAPLQVPVPLPPGYGDALLQDFAVQYEKAVSDSPGERILLSKPGVHFWRRLPHSHREVRILS